MSSLADVITQGFREYRDGMVKKMRRNVDNACKEVTKEIREDIHDQWKPNGYASLSAAAANHYHPYTTANMINLTSVTIKCTTRTYVESGDFKPGGNTTQEWQDRHQGVSCIDGVEWILTLQMNQGLIALPPYSGHTSTGYNGRLVASSWNKQGETWSRGTNKRLATTYANRGMGIYSPHGPLATWTASAPQWSQFESKVLSRL